MNEVLVRSVLFFTAALVPAGLAAQITDPTAGNMPASVGMNPAAPTPGSMVSTAPGGTNSGMAPLTASNSSMRDTLGAPGLNGRQLRDQQFLRKVTQSDLAQIEISRLAAERGGPEVKDFAQRMIDDHTATSKDLGQVADHLGVLLPKKLSKDDQEEYDRLKALTGDDFDKAYIGLELKEHREDLHQFRLEASNAVDPNLQTEVANAYGVVRQHMQLAVKLAEEKGVPLPQKPPRPNPAPATPQ